MDYTHGMDAKKSKKTIENILKRKTEYIEKDGKWYKKHSKNIYLNAYNGANFDHYFLVKMLLMLGHELKDFVLKGGSIFRAKLKNITFIDLCKHTTGSFKANLKTMGCKLAKGDFDHKKGNDWDKMLEQDSKNGTNFAKDCIEYLKIDVMGLKELYNKINEALNKDFKINIHSFFSTSHTTFSVWKDHMMKHCKSVIKIPTRREELAFRPSCFGGRCYPSKKMFESIERNDYLKGKLDYNKVYDYLMDLDVVSLYPSVMQFHDFPVGKVIEVKNSNEHNKYIRENNKCKFAGIYYIKYIANKYLSHAILPHREQFGLKWTLADGEGYYTSVDIDNALQYGYKIEIVKPEDKYEAIGFYWEKTKKIFESYIKKLFEKKKRARRGTPERALAKLFMNGLYGKMIQRPISNKTTWAKSLSEFWKFYKNHKISDVEMINEQMYITGISRDESQNEKCISKPTQLGSFILGYTRRLMLKYYAKSNPYFDRSNHPSGKDSEEAVRDQCENDFYYTDTDSVQVHNKNRLSMSKEIGCMDDDLKDFYKEGGSAKIIRGIYISPKLYMIEFITSDSDNPINDKDKKHIEEKECEIKIIDSRKVYYIYRGKGVPTDKLNTDAFEKMYEGKEFSTQRDFQMKKNNINLNNPQKNRGISNWDIEHKTGKDTQRILNKTKWAARKWIGNVSLPHC